MVPVNQSTTLPIVAGPVRGIVCSRVTVIALLLFAGPIGLLPLWFSPRFSRVAKIAWTAFFVSMSIILPIALTLYWCTVALRPLVDAFAAALQP